MQGDAIFGFPMLVPYCLLLLLIGGAFYTDVKYGKILNRLTMNAIAIGLLYHVVTAGWSGFVFALLGFGTGFGLFMLLYLFKALGAGDVKLFGAIGAMMGVDFTLQSMMYAIVYAGIIGVLILLFRQQFMSKLTAIYYYFVHIFIGRRLASFNYAAQHAVLTFPFMYAVVPAVITTVYLQIKF